MKSIALAAVAVCLFSIGSASAKTVTSTAPETMISALQSAGYKAVLGKTDDGTPVIDTAADSNPIRIALSDCKDNKSCTTSEFIGVWDCASSVEKCKTVADELNRQESPMHFITMDSGKRIITYQYLLFDDIGISDKLFISNFEAFSHYNYEFNAAVSKK